MKPTITLAGQTLGPGAPTYVIAEAGVNHNGALARALELVEAARRCGADAVKFQTFHAERLCPPTVRKADYQVEQTGGDETQYEMLRRLQLSEADFEVLFARAQELGITFLSTPFDEEALAFLVDLGVPALKIGSTDNLNPLLLRAAARSGLPIIYSTGMSRVWEAIEAVELLEAAGATEVVITVCTTEYPATPRTTRLRAMDVFRDLFGIPVGLSDHSLGWHLSLAAVARGADLIENHFTLDRTLPGPDHTTSLDPPMLDRMVREIREVEEALACPPDARAPQEDMNATVAHKSIVALRDIAAGEVLSSENIAVMRPGIGLAPRLWDVVCGSQVMTALAAGTPLQWEHLLRKMMN